MTTKTIAKKAPKEEFSQKKFISDLIDSGLEYQDIADELAVSKSSVYSWHRETSTMPEIAKKYFNLKFGSADNMIYERQLSNLRNLLMKLKRNSRAESDVKDIVDKVFA